MRCPKHGEYEPRELPSLGGGTFTVPGCPKCGAEREEIRANLENESRVRQHLEDSGIPERLQRATFDSYEAGSTAQQKAKQAVMGYAAAFRIRKQDGTCLVLTGKPGTGKSHLACAAGMEIIRAGHTVKYITEHHMERFVKATYGKNSDRSEEQVISDYLKPALLILDEVGVSRGSESDGLILYEVIGGRYNAVLPTLVVGNLTVPELTKHIGERAFDRLREGGGVVVPFTWESYRGRK